MTMKTEQIVTKEQRTARPELKYSATTTHGRRKPCEVLACCPYELETRFDVDDRPAMAWDCPTYGCTCPAIFGRGPDGEP